MKALFKSLKIKQWCLFSNFQKNEKYISTVQVQKLRLTEINSWDFRRRKVLHIFKKSLDCRKTVAEIHGQQFPLKIMSFSSLQAQQVIYAAVLRIKSDI